MTTLPVRGDPSRPSGTPLFCELRGLLLPMLMDLLKVLVGDSRVVDEVELLRITWDCTLRVIVLLGVVPPVCCRWGDRATLRKIQRRYCLYCIYIVNRISSENHIDALF